MASEFKIKNGLIVVGDVSTSGTITINGALAATQSWVDSQAYLTSSSLTSYATQSYVTSAIASLVDSAPGALDTLRELATALGNDASFSTTVTNSIASKQNASTAINTSNIASQSVSYANSAGSAGYVTNQSGQLASYDNRTISPSETNASYLQFGFTSFNNNNTAPWADYLHLRSYEDSSAGADNLVVFNKSTIGMRIYQQTFGSASAYSSYADVWHSGNLTNLNQLTNGPGYITASALSPYLPLAGGTMSGILTFSSAYNAYIYTFSRVGLANQGRIIYNNGTGSNMFFGELASNVYGFTTNAYTDTPALSFNLSTNNVGIGTASPGTNKLHVFNGSSGGVAYNPGGLVVESSGRASIQLLAPNNQDSYLFFGDANSGTGGYIGHYGTTMSPADLMVYYSEGNHNFTNGNVGIGTSSPQKKLDVFGSAGILASFGSNISPGNFAGLHFGYSESYANNDNYKKSALVFERTDNNNHGSNASGKIHFLLNNSSGTSANALTDSVVTIDSDANGTAGSVRMGIGTRNPSTPLHVVGIVQVEGGGSTTFYGTDGSGSYARNFGTQLYTFRDTGGSIITTINTTSGVITTTGGNSTQWNTAYSWGNHASADYIVRGTQIASSAAWTTATRFGSVGNISQDAGNHALSVRSEQNNDAFMSFHIGGDYAVHFGLERDSNRMSVGGWSDGAVKYQLWDSRDFTSTNVSNWNTAYGWGNHASAGYLTSVSDIWVNTTGDTMTGSLSFSEASVIKKRFTTGTNNPVKTASGVLTSRSDNSGGSTYYIIETNVPQDDYQMGGFTIEIFGNYSSTNHKTKIDLGGYWNPESNGGFEGFEAHGSNPQYKPTIEVARNTSGKTVFIIYGGSWNYPVIVARDLWLGYTGSDGGTYGEGWSIIGTSDISSYVNRDTVVWRNAYSDSNPAGYITGYTETDTLNSVTGRGNTTGNNIITSANVYASIFYDYSDNGYYLDPNGNSVLTTATFNVNASSTLILTSAGTNASQIKAGAGDELYIGGNNSWQMRFSGANVLMDNGGYLQNNESLRAPIFYDSNDTNYYGDFAGTSRFNNLYIEGAVASLYNASGYASAAIEVRERNFAGAQDDTWSTAPRIGFHWAGRVAAQIAIASNGRIHILNDPGTLNEAFQAAIIYSSGYGDSTQWNTAYGWGNHASASYATTSYVTTQINNLVNGAPGALDTLNELATALGNDASFATTVTNSIATKLPLAGGTMSGALNLANNDIQGVGSIYISDPGAGEGINWNGGNGWGIFECPDVFDNTAGNLQFALNATTRLMTLNTAGALWIAGALTEASSLKLKENVETSEGNLEKVVNLRPVTYNKIGSQTKELGLIAEEVATVYPEFVQYDESGEPVGVNYSRLTAALIGAVKELTQRIETLENNG